MADGHFSALSRKIPDREYATFKDWLLEKAGEEQSEHLFTDRYANVGLTLTYLLEVYEAGKAKKIPESWIPLYNQMKQEQSKEYQTYLMLKDKYEEQHRVSEITIEKAFDVPEEEPKKEPALRASSKKRRKKSTRNIKKDGKVSSFY